jgi:hypothetical protein
VTRRQEKDSLNKILTTFETFAYALVALYLRRLIHASAKRGPGAMSGT